MNSAGQIEGKSWITRLREGSQPWLGTCALDSCHRRTHLPVFWSGLFLDDKWYCSPTCVEQEVRLRLNREASPGPSHRITHRIPLGLLMMSQGIITADQLQLALAMQRKTNRRRIGDCLQEAGLTTEQQVTCALAAQWNCPVLHAGVQPDARFAGLVPLTLQEEFGMIPVHFSSQSRVLYVGFEQSVHYSLLYAIAHVLSCRTEPCIIDHSILEKQLEVRRMRKGTSETVFDVRDSADIASIIANYFVRYGAKQIRMAVCTGCVWVRLRCESRAGDLVFRRRFSSTTTLPYPIPPLGHTKVGDSENSLSVGIL